MDVASSQLVGGRGARAAFPAEAAGLADRVTPSAPQVPEVSAFVHVQLRQFKELTRSAIDGRKAADN